MGFFRQSIVFIFYSLLCLTVIIVSLSVENRYEKEVLSNLNRPSENQIFKIVDFYYIDQKNSSMQMNSSFMHLSPEGNSYAKEVKGKYYNPVEQGYDVWDFTAKEVEVPSTKNILILNEDVVLWQKHKRFKSEQLVLEKDRETLTAKESVDVYMNNIKNKQKMKLSSDEMVYWLKPREGLFKGKVKGEILRNRRYEGRVDFSAEEIRLKELENLVTLSSNIVFKRGDFKVLAQNGEIYLGNFNKRLKYYLFSDDIQLEQKLIKDNGKPIKRMAYGSRLEGFIKEKKIFLSGTPRVVQEDDIIKGFQIVLRENTDIVEVEDSQTSFEIKKKRK